MQRSEDGCLGYQQPGWLAAYYKNWRCLSMLLFLIPLVNLYALVETGPLVPASKGL
jgi:hypothetical protein